jgi:hypothetical protein
MLTVWYIFDVFMRLLRLHPKKSILEILCGRLIDLSIADKINLWQMILSLGDYSKKFSY